MAGAIAINMSVVDSTIEICRGSIDFPFEIEEGDILELRDSVQELSRIELEELNKSRK